MEVYDDASICSETERLRAPTASIRMLTQGPSEKGTASSLLIVRRVLSSSRASMRTAFQQQGKRGEVTAPRHGLTLLPIRPALGGCSCMRDNATAAACPAKLDRRQHQQCLTTHLPPRSLRLHTRSPGFSSLLSMRSLCCQAPYAPFTD
jgi:hypothetical protein